MKRQCAVLIVLKLNRFTDLFILPIIVLYRDYAVVTVAGWQIQEMP